MFEKFVFWWKRYIIFVIKMLDSLVNEMHIIYVVIIIKIAIVRLLVFLRIFLKILELIFESIILIRFNKFLVLIVESNLFRYIFENLISFLLLNLKLKTRSRIILRSKRIWRFIQIIERWSKRKTRLLLFLRPKIRSRI